MKTRHGTLTGSSTVDTVAITYPNADWVAVIIREGATGPIYFTVDGSEPTVGGNDTLIVQSVGEHARLVQIPTTAETVTVKMVSATADGYTVEVWD